jgi:hypothetical protein
MHEAGIGPAIDALSEVLTRVLDTEGRKLVSA